ncbi:hypothetical protein CK226_31375 [Mesorhizobium sp. WSM4311]|nr:hypothetical protein CK226_31375 [Mesorhizobium sp. WSM4311]
MHKAVRDARVEALSGFRKAVAGGRRRQRLRRQRLAPSQRTEIHPSWSMNWISLGTTTSGVASLCHCRCTMAVSIALRLVEGVQPLGRQPATTPAASAPSARRSAHLETARSGS